MPSLAEEELLLHFLPSQDLFSSTKNQAVAAAMMIDLAYLAKLLLSSSNFMSFNDAPEYLSQWVCHYIYK